MQSRNYQDLSRGDDDRDFRQGRQDGTGQNNHTSEYGNYGMRDDHRHYDGAQQGAGWRRLPAGAPAGLPGRLLWHP